MSYYISKIRFHQFSVYVKMSQSFSLPKETEGNRKMNLIDDKLILNLRKINSPYLEIWPELSLVLNWPWLKL